MGDEFMELGEQAREAMLAFAEDCSNLRWRARLIDAAAVVDEALESQCRGEEADAREEESNRRRAAMREEEETRAADMRAFHEHSNACKAAWRDLTQEGRERAVLELLGAGGITARELHGRASDADPWSPVYGISTDNLRAFLTEMMRGPGSVRREEIVAGSPNRGYQWFPVQRPLDGPIADLERAFHEEDGSDG